MSIIITLFWNMPKKKRRIIYDMIDMFWIIHIYYTILRIKKEEKKKQINNSLEYNRIEYLKRYIELKILNS